MLSMNQGPIRSLGSHLKAEDEGCWQLSVPRFFHAELPSSGMINLGEAESRHAQNVLRLTVGQQVALFDGQGGEALAVIKDLQRRAVLVEILTRTDTNRELLRPLELLVALPKGERQKVLVDGLVQFGATRLIPLVCERGVAQPSPGAVSRLQRSVIESSKQCGRNHLLQIYEPLTVRAAINSQPSSSSLQLFAHPYGCESQLGDYTQRGQASSVRVAIGPEGGFTEKEVEIWEAAGWEQVMLGSRILRIEMAALQVAAWWATIAQ
jgi:16S rRNA (uracil1498-N3)-methyltransferase